MKRDISRNQRFTLELCKMLSKSEIMLLLLLDQGCQNEAKLKKGGAWRVD